MASNQRILLARGAIWKKPISDFLDAKKRIRRFCQDCLNGVTPLPAERRCTQCGQVKAVLEFSKNKGRTPKSWCKHCSRAVKARWYLDNQDRVQQYTEEHREQKRIHAANAAMQRRARLARVYREKVDRKAVIARDNGTCYLCGAKPTGRDLTLDHIVPLFLGGAHAEYNLRVACRSCNSHKGTKAPIAGWLG